jgi:hypothetical protein
MSAPQPLPIQIPPGVVATESALASAGRWVLPWQNARFVNGRPQKIGGSALAAATPTSGIPRTIHAWRDLTINGYLAVGTYRKLYVYDTSFAQNDITPFRATGTLPNNPFTTTASSTLVSVGHTAHGLAAGDTVIFSGSAAVGGITPNGTFTVFTVTNSNVYTFNFTSAASSSVTGGGASVLYSYEIPIGTEFTTYGLGYGVGGYGLGTYGTAHSSSTVVVEARVWSLTEFGKILIASYNGGSIYTFDPTVAQPWPRAQVIAAAPTDCRAVFVTPERYVFALRENLVVSSSDQGDYTVWTPATGNTAFSRTLNNGSKLVSGRALEPFISLVWTDGALFKFQYTGDAFVYQSSFVAGNCGLIGPNAAVCVNGVAYWIGTDNLFMYNGTVQPIPNVEDVRRYIFDALDKVSGYQCYASYNPTYNEIWFGYLSSGELGPSRRAIYHINDQCWSLHPESRVSGTHFSSGDTRPYMGDITGYLYQHENTYDSAGVSIAVTMTIAPYMVAEGQSGIDVESVFWDFKDQFGNITATINTYDRIDDVAPMDTDSVNVAALGLSEYRVSGRYISFTLTQDVLGGYFRHGHSSVFWKPAGRRT